MGRTGSSNKSKRKRSATIRGANKAAQTSSLFGPIASNKQKPKKTPRRGGKSKTKTPITSHHQYKHKQKTPHYCKQVISNRGGTKIPIKSLRKKKNHFRLCLPNQEFLDCRHVPWYNKNDESDKETKSTTTTKRQNENRNNIKLPHNLFREKVLTELDHELLQFAKYVQLLPEEQEAREFLISEISNYAQALFPQMQISIQAFGSHATPEVCCFASDVDLVLWGVVPCNKHTRTFVEEEHEKQREQKEDCNVNGNMNKKQARVNRWRQVLKEAEETVETREEEDQKKKACNSNDGADTSHHKMNDAIEDKEETGRETATAESIAAPREVVGDSSTTNDLPANDCNKEEPKGLLFVIDRVGVEEENYTVPVAKNSDADGNTLTSSGTQKPLVPASTSTQEEVSKKEEPDCKPGSSREQPIDLIDSPKRSPARKAIDEASVADDIQNRTALHAAGISKKKETRLAQEDDNDSSSQTAVDLCSDSEDDDSDNDSADKLQGFRRDRSFSNSHDDDTKNEDARWDALVEEKRRTVSLSSSTTNTDVEDDSDDITQYQDMQVSFVSRQREPLKTIGPTGQTRKLVVGALQSLGKRMRQSSFTHTVEVRKFARVPIINMATHLGFESDVAVGGHNGTDTSQYASVQTERYNSFAVVVLFLKILLAQQDLDKPFTGGLGSYKLYVLVAHHMERHVALGGSDRPSEILLAFFFRYGGRKDVLDIDSGAATLLSQDVVLHSSGGSADLQPVFNLEHCTRLFSVCWERLLNWSDGKMDGSSFLGNVIDAEKLRRDREDCHRKACLWRKTKNKTNGIAADHPGKVSAGRKVGHVFSKTNNSRRKAASKRKRYQDEANTDDEANRLMAGYGLQRGARGGLIPRHRPDVKARKMADPSSELIGRARKNRKNKKKQKRDEGLSHFANNASYSPPKTRRQRGGKKGK